jgi:CheY-like chemotaxis protein
MKTSSTALTSAMVLIVDDREDQRSVFRSIANHLGFGCHIVGSWLEAEAAIGTIAFDVVLMDWKMPNVDGIQATKLLRAYDEPKGQYTPVIAVTAHAMADDRKICLESGMDDYLSKPFTVQELHDKIVHWLEQRAKD